MILCTNAYIYTLTRTISEENKSRKNIYQLYKVETKILKFAYTYTYTYTYTITEEKKRGRDVLELYKIMN